MNKVRIKMEASVGGSYYNEYDADGNELSSLCAETVNKLMGREGWASGKILARASVKRPKRWRGWFRVKPQLRDGRPLGPGLLVVKGRAVYMLCDTQLRLQSLGFDIAKPFWAKFTVLEK